MIKPRLRLYVCASAVAVTLGGSMLTHAAGPGEFISRLWKRDAAPRKEVQSGFSPFRWLKRRESDSVVGHVKVSDGGRRVVSERPGLVSDPFLAEQQRQAAPATTPATSPAGNSESPSRIIVRPTPRSRDQQQAAELVLADKPATAPRLPNDGQPGRAAISDARSDRLPELRTGETSDRPAGRHVRPSAPRPGNRDGFVENFDSEFQRLFAEVIEESRQQKEQLSSPKLPDDVVADFGAKTEETASKDAFPMVDRRQPDVAEFTPERSRESLDELIRQSRSQMESSVLAQQAGTEQPVLQSSQGMTGRNSVVAARSGVSAVSHSASRVRPSDHEIQTNGGFQQGRPSAGRRETDHQLIVPSSMVPDGRLFTPSIQPINQDSGHAHSVQRQEKPPALQPVVRVVPGDRGNGVTIDSGRTAPARPRVSSNVAPTRSVPDTSPFRRLSFEGTTTEDEGGIIQSINNDSQTSLPPSAPDADRMTNGTAFFQPELSSGDIAGSEGHAVGDIPLMMIPDNQAASSMDAAELGASLAAVPGPPVERQMVFEWPDESEIGPSESARGGNWGFTLFCLAIVAGAVSVFFRRKSQAGAIGMIGTGTESEIS